MKKLLVLGMLILTGCSGETLSVDLTNTTVSLNVFSGLPDPSWQLTRVEADQLEDRLRDLPATSPVEIPGHLGYRGFTIRSENGHTQYITVTSTGYVVIHSNSGDKFYRDTRGVEDWLLLQAKARGHANLITRD